MPEVSRDPIVVATTLVQALQSVVSRNVSPLRSAVLSVTQIHAGSAYNVIPEEATISGTVRFLDSKVNELIRERIHTIAAGLAASFGIEIEVNIRNVFDVLLNSEDFPTCFMWSRGSIAPSGTPETYLYTTRALS